MLTNIVKATRAHYAALQHRAAADRVPLDYAVTVADGVTRGCIQVKAANNVARKRELTKLQNRLIAMYPEYVRIECEFRARGAL